MFSEVAEIALVATRLGQFQQLLKTRAITNYNYACLFVGYVEQQIREQYTGFIPQLHKRYIDDIVGAASCQRDELENFIDFVSNFHPALQFTSTITETELPFLDINLRISEDRIHTSIFYKETDTHN